MDWEKAAMACIGAIALSALVWFATQVSKIPTMEGDIEENRTSIEENWKRDLQKE